MQRNQPVRSAVYPARVGGAPLAARQGGTPQEVFSDPVVQLAALCPLCALAAISPKAALAALSPVLRLFNPAINPNAALLAFGAFDPVRRQRGRTGR